MIINMSSVAGVQAWAGTGTYSASKHGILALTKSLADEGRPHHIRVSAICPGGVADDLVDASPEEILRTEKIDQPPSLRSNERAWKEHFFFYKVNTCTG